MPVKYRHKVGAGTKDVQVYTKSEVDRAMSRSKKLMLENEVYELEEAERRLNEELKKLDDELTELNEVKIPEMEGKHATLDGYIQDPSTMPEHFEFFEGILTNEIWATDGIFTNAWIDNVIASNIWANKVTTNELNTEEIRAEKAFIENLLAENITVTGTLTTSSGGSFNGSIEADSFIAKGAGASLEMGDDGFEAISGNTRIGLQRYYKLNLAGGEESDPLFVVTGDDFVFRNFSFHIQMSARQLNTGGGLSAIYNRYVTTGGTDVILDEDWELISSRFSTEWDGAGVIVEVDQSITDGFGLTAKNNHATQEVSLTLYIHELRIQS